MLQKSCSRKIIDNMVGTGWCTPNLDQNTEDLSGVDGCLVSDSGMHHEKPRPKVVNPQKRAGDRQLAASSVHMDLSGISTTEILVST